MPRTTQRTRVIPLADAPGERSKWGRPARTVYLWAIVELLLVTNPWQISSALRVKALRAFGADIGHGVIFRPRTRVKFPWNLHIGNDCWIGEGVWFHNQDHVTLGNNVVLSQETFLTTGSHAHRRDMALITAPIHIEDGCWVTTRCIILGGTHLGQSVLVTPMTVVSGRIPAGKIVGTPGAVILGDRFPETTTDNTDDTDTTGADQ
ncbi:acetyltransferase [Cryobacterium melibiosiphilum]|uniref:Acetyltransferase n=1 Tax=Cryobacterium melibiosiphilum TaxID=995039 RepID=A0A3A5MNT0_9MICO|nr:acetyltransferase [Cryobacterium melibiosiphilum]RJT91022.1 acetyltransferase [Cryobacterium melibiosiphilum]